MTEIDPKEAIRITLSGSIEINDGARAFLTMFGKPWYEATEEFVVNALFAGLSIKQVQEFLDQFPNKAPEGYVEKS